MKIKYQENKFFLIFEFVVFHLWFSTKIRKALGFTYFDTDVSIILKEMLHCCHFLMKYFFFILISSHIYLLDIFSDILIQHKKTVMLHYSNSHCVHIFGDRPFNQAKVVEFKQNFQHSSLLFDAVFYAHSDTITRLFLFICGSSEDPQAFFENICH